MDRLPHDLLCKIFLETLPERREIEYKQRHSAPFLMPLYISHVCKKWREVALSLGELWSFLCITYNGGEESKLRITILEVFDTFLERTNGSPLNFTFYCYLSRGLQEDSRRVAEHITTTLLSEQSRWRDVDFVWTGLQPSPHLQGISATNMPMLTALALHVSIYSDDGAPIVAHVSTAHSLSLERLTLLGNFTLETGDDPILTLRQPSMLMFEDECTESAAVDTCVEFLKSAPRLTDFHACFDCKSSDLTIRQNDETMFVSSNLQKLKLESGRPSAFVLKDMTLPSLAVLFYEYGRYEGGGEILFRFIQRSSPPLTYLELYDYGAEEDVLISTIRLLPTLLQLRISGATVSTQFFQTLTMASNNSAPDASPAIEDHVICPGLRLLCLGSLRILGNRDTCINALISMLNSRKQIFKVFKLGGYGRTRAVDLDKIDLYELQECLNGSTFLAQTDDIITYPFGLR
ncbi:uncharacterized protein FOMMEDRAFT_160580 [Fomitiporia mediterranea MF3/22]|uniref:uncharacterized protein n=1 Tax=Fomitiporia mediterranea (strain MF3/22) TaxID=694068 RepID=UPI00044099B2|nr:uncharacterized protein FOMMEDRAFT_160580 [Fomitiporia mediterranea MF3/22]EJC99511.1 hypothetical protein FOMMEDRAFT_160580 [Fomitiporia mediterranea MF3/22]